MIDGKYLSYILRHAPSAANVQLDGKGYVRVDELIDGIKQTGRNTDFDELEKIVANDGKRRFSFNENRTKIRANYGHSVAVDLQMQAIVPPTFLYHGTATKFLDRIAAEGINRRSRNFVHLTDNFQTALAVGARHGQADVLIVAAQAMHKYGFPFYLSESGVWLTKSVPPRYIFQESGSTSDSCDIVPFEMSHLGTKRTGIAGNIWVYDTGKRVESSGYRLIYENADAMVFVYFDGVFPKVQGDFSVVASDLPQVIPWIEQNKKALLKLYDRQDGYDIADFYDEAQPIATSKS